MDFWRYIEEDNVSADYGLATDEFLMGKYAANQPASAPTLRLYTYRSHCALVGRFQNLFAELNLENCQQENVQIGRRPTGGGAIIMGRDQLGLCLTLSTATEMGQGRSLDLYHRFSTPIISMLRKMGIQANFRPKNDIEVNGRKIAGLGIFINEQGALLFHTSLLVDLNIPLMLRILNIPSQKISDKALIRTIRQRITTISSELGTRITTDQIRPLLKESFKETFGIQMKTEPITPAERETIAVLEKEKYRNDNWLYQRTPQVDMTGMSIIKTPAGLLRIYASLFGETIKNVLITGDFIEHSQLFSQIESRLKWSPVSKEKITHAVEEVFSENNEDFPFPMEKLIRAIWQAIRRAKQEKKFTYRGTCYYPGATKASAPRLNKLEIITRRG